MRNPNLVAVLFTIFIGLAVSWSAKDEGGVCVKETDGREQSPCVHGQLVWGR